MNELIGDSMRKALNRLLLVWSCALLGGLLFANTTLAQTVTPDAAAPEAADNVAITIESPARASRGGEPVSFELAVENTHPRQVVTFTALIMVEAGLAGPESWSEEVSPVADTQQGRIYRWIASVAPRRTATLEATSRTGNTLGVQPALTVHLLSDQDQLISRRQIELVASRKQAQGSMELTDLAGEQCDLAEQCLLLLTVTSPSLQSFSSGVVETVGCEFLGLDEEFSVTAERIEEELFWLVTRTSGEYGRGCSISVPITMGSRSFTVIYRELVHAYLPLVESNEIAR